MLLLVFLKLASEVSEGETLAFDTKIVRETFGQAWGKPEDGAKAIRLLIERSLADQITGEYFDVDKAARANAQAYDERARARLRTATQEMLAPLLAAA